MKTWNEIENRLKNEGGGTPPPGLHHRIMRTVRDDRAAETMRIPHALRLPWLLAGAAACALAVSVVQFRPATAEVVASPAAPDFSLAMFEVFAMSPVQTELQNLRADLVSAAQFVSDCVPVGSDETGT